MTTLADDTQLRQWLGSLHAGGMFRVENFDAVVAAQDNFGPSKISDLQVVESVYNTDYFKIGWTTPGDDLTYGTGTCT